MEITDVNRIYLERGQLSVEIMGRGYAWLDTGTPDSLLDAAEFVRVLEKRQGFKIASPEEVAFHKGFIGIPEMERAIERLGRSDYGRYLRRIIESTFFIELDKDKLAQLATRLRESILLCLRKPPRQRGQIPRSRPSMWCVWVWPSGCVFRRP
jgi:hypothetical protein